MRHLYHRLAAARRGCFLLAGWLVAGLAHAQAPAWDGATTGSTGQGSGYSVIQAVATDALGNVFVTGNFTGTAVFGATTLVSAGGSDLFVAKYVPATGTWAWAQRGGGTNADAGQALAVSGNRVYVTGSYYNNRNNANNVFFGGTSPATSLAVVAGAGTTAGLNLVLACYTDDGSSATLTWTQTGGGNGGTYGNGVAASGNRVYVLGNLYNNLVNSRAIVFGGSGATPGTTTVRGATSAQSADYVLACYTDNGPAATLAWTQVAGGTSDDYSTAVAVSGSSLYVTGNLANTSSNANSVMFGGDGSGLVGTSPQAGTSALLNQDVVLAKYTDNGSTATFNWSQIGGGTGYDTGAAVAVSGSSIYVAGSLANDSGNSLGVVFGGSGLTAGTRPVSGASTVSYQDIFLAKYQDNGTSGSYQWSQVGGGTGIDFGRAVAVSGNRVYVGGQLRNSASDANLVRLANGSVALPGVGPTVGDDLALLCYTDNGATGTCAWGKVGGGDNADYCFGLALGGQQVYAGGRVAPPATFGPVTIGSVAGIGDLHVLASLTDPAITPLATAAALAAGLALYPNPTRATATLRGAPPGTAVQVLDMLGRPVATATADAAGTAALRQLPAGLYLVRVGSHALRLRVE